MDNSITRDLIGNTIVCGDSRVVLKDFSDQSIDLIFTSPPYADQRKETYGGIHPDKYVEWFLPFSEEFKRVLKTDGTFILNIKEKVVKAERHIYVINLIQALREQGWLWTEEFIWRKKNSMPGKWPNRFRDGWERLLQFNPHRKFRMYQDAVMIPVSDWIKTRLNRLSAMDKTRTVSSTGSGFGKNLSNWVDREMVYPDNVLYISTEISDKGHSAAFPQELPEWFIKLFTLPGDTVLDPFLGSGTTAAAAFNLDRRYVGIEIKPEFYRLAVNRVRNLGV